MAFEPFRGRNWLGELQYLIGFGGVFSAVSAVAVAAKALAFLVATVAAALLWRLVRDARRVDPFSGATVRRLRQLAWLVLVGGFASAGVSTLAAAALADGLLVGANATYAPAIWLLLGVGTGIGAVAEVVNRGVAMRAELDAVI